jgi:type IV pilus assembly protein PilC
MLVYIIPIFKSVFEGLMGGTQLPAFTRFVMQISDAVRLHAPYVLLGILALGILLTLGLKTQLGRWTWDRLKLALPILGKVFRQAAISRFSRTLGTLLGNGVPILQALTIVRETAGNVVVGSAVSAVHDAVKEGESITAPLRDSKVFPPMVIGMVDVGEQTGALPDMLLKIADTYDEEVDTSVNSMTSLLEPFFLVVLAVIVGSIVIAMFLPLIQVCSTGFETTGRE